MPTKMEPFLRKSIELENLSIPNALSVSKRLRSRNIFSDVICFICEWSAKDEYKTWLGISTNIQDYPAEYHNLPFLKQENLVKQLEQLNAEFNYIEMRENGWIYPTRQFAKFIVLLCASDSLDM